ncbi:dephospho-CoA kinase [Rivibacter subsaxonicus]|uniref:Dephospho-CoA kinase n=1 Tax=Rivibacter subsaxonicus TaxID=457575 RepID=A0A4Q7VG60_9BURK|nr:dephospho-CoA kinase [Rivibacter subsaxonicus]RZT95001.1 dephospho-CoA kinase [Rivibacter subsaxonicus]
MDAAITRIGLTGGIGSGKSTAAAILQQLGATLIDTDAIARELTLAGGAAIEPLRAAFGSACIGADGALDRAWMRAHAFADPTARRRLEAILHPLIGARANRLAALAGPQATLLFDVPLLVESTHWRGRVQRVLVIDCPPEVQLARVMRRPGWSREAALAVIGQQATRERRRAAADAVVDNRRDDPAALEQGLTALWRQWHSAFA